MELKVPAPLVNIAHDLQLSSIYPHAASAATLKEPATGRWPALHHRCEENLWTVSRWNCLCPPSTKHASGSTQASRFLRRHLGRKTGHEPETGQHPVPMSYRTRPSIQAWTVEATARRRLISGLKKRLVTLRDKFGRLDVRDATDFCFERATMSLRLRNFCR